MIAIYDEQLVKVGTKTRREVHEKGYWHKTFHCWILLKEQTGYSIYLQLRSKQKKDYPHLFDITAAGHLLAHETVEDGIREVQEELGIAANAKEFILLGVIKNTIISKKMIDKEFSYVHIYVAKEIPAFMLQQEEVAGMVKGSFKEFYQLCMGEKNEMAVHGFAVRTDHSVESIEKRLDKSNLVPHEKAYWKNAALLIKNYLDKH